MSSTSHVRGRGPIHKKRVPSESLEDSQHTVYDSELEEHSQPCLDSEVDSSDDADFSTNSTHENISQERKQSIDRVLHQPDYVPQSYNWQSQKQVPTSNSKLYILLMTSGIILALIIYYNPWYTMKKSVPRSCSFDSMKKDYPNQTSMLWLTLQVGVESIINKTQESPHVYLFVHHAGFAVDGLITDIARHSSFCIDEKMVPVEMKYEDFKSEQAIEDYGYVIDKYKQKIQNGQVVLIVNLNKIPAKAARALHSICDTISPIASNVLIFLTLTIPSSAEGHLASVTEDELNALWGQTLQPHELDPLIARVTDHVVFLKS